MKIAAALLSVSRGAELLGTCATNFDECQRVTITSTGCFDREDATMEATNAELEGDFDGLTLFTGQDGFVSTALSVTEIKDGTAGAAPDVNIVDAKGAEGVDDFWFRFNFADTVVNKIIVCGTFTTVFEEQPGEPTLDEAAWTTKVNDEFSASLTNANVTETAISAGLISPPTDNKCEGTETYNEDLSGNGFLAEWGDGFKINKVIAGRGNSTVPYTAYGDGDPFHNEGDKIRLECKMGYTHDLGKRVMQAECKCDENGACAWAKKTPEWDCISSDHEQAIPIWGGAVNNFVKRVESKYIILKARVTNGMKLETWDHDRVDTDAHPEYLDNAWWGTQPFTMFVWCPFDTRKGGLDPTSNEGTMTFGDFYPGDCTPDGKMCSFLSREGVHAWRTPESTANVKAGLHGTAFFKGYIDRSSVEADQGPISLEANKPDQWSCETGLLPGHQPDAISNMRQYFHMFKDGNFDAMLNYMRPNKDLPELEDL